MAAQSTQTKRVGVSPSISSPSDIEQRKHQLVEQIGAMTIEFSNMGRVVRDVSDRTIERLSSSEKIIQERLLSNTQAFKQTAKEINKTHQMIEEVVETGKTILNSADGSLQTLSAYVDKIDKNMTALQASSSASSEKIQKVSEANSREVEKLTEKLAITATTLRATSEDIKKILEDDLTNGRKTSSIDTDHRDLLNQIKSTVADIRGSSATNISISEIKALIGSIRADLSSTDKRIAEKIDSSRSDMTLVTEECNKILRQSDESNILLRQLLERVNNLDNKLEEMKKPKSRTDEEILDAASILSQNKKLNEEIRNAIDRSQKYEERIASLEKEIKERDTLYESRQQLWVDK
jgi:chromosome segregation ATPase